MDLLSHHENMVEYGKIITKTDSFRVALKYHVDLEGHGIQKRISLENGRKGKRLQLLFVGTEQEAWATEKELSRRPIAGVGQMLDHRKHGIAERKTKEQPVKKDGSNS